MAPDGFEKGAQHVADRLPAVRAARVKQFMEDAGDLLGQFSVMPVLVAQTLDQPLSVVSASCRHDGWKQDLILKPVHSQQRRWQPVCNLAASGCIDAARQGVGNRLEAITQSE
ncbi:hypothetical protein ASD00_05045 [Ensifer sp. Root31]|nr:hypothetical protein ASD00_05045 [Ensifer sp. Root31]